MTTKQTQHSPIPWTIKPNDPTLIIDAKDRATADVFGDGAMQRYANARMIVRVVNSHYTLVHCLSRAVATEEQLARLDGRDPEDWCVSARAVLALAQGEGR